MGLKKTKRVEQHKKSNSLWGYTGLWETFRELIFVIYMFNIFRQKETCKTLSNGFTSQFVQKMCQIDHFSNEVCAKIEPDENVALKKCNLWALATNIWAEHSP